MKQVIERLRKLADDAVKEYNAEHVAGGEAVYPAWANDMKAVISYINNLENHNTLQAAQLQKQAREMVAGNRFTPHWYAVDSLGIATQCVSERDAIESAKEFAETWPNRSPYFVGRIMAITQQEQV